MDDFPKNLIVAIVISVVAVAIGGGLIFLFALHWSRVVQSVTPESWKTPKSEKAWPQSRGSVETGYTSSPVDSPPQSWSTTSPTASPRSSGMSGATMLKK
ncbi:hypothetical protein F5X99DRAFT_20301 [Biscogniauxia marginata]|nr:hypothetical protein F5X99DRAFT_20301 [Biscogniauxia marginata]